ncbi:MAG TPA: hypothetical protein V6C85_17890 [Allocoleopsis sp.]
MDALDIFRHFSPRKLLCLFAAILSLGCGLWILISPRIDGNSKLSAASLAGTTAIAIISFNGETIAQKEREITNKGRKIQEMLSALEQNEISWPLAAKLLIQSLKEDLPSDVISEKLYSNISPEMRERVETLTQKLEGYLKRINVCQELARYLEDDEIQTRLLGLSKKAGDYVIKNTDSLRLKNEQLTDDKKKEKFYGDIYRHLRVWLKNNIEYDMALPEMTLPEIARVFQYTDSEMLNIKKIL